MQRLIDADWFRRYVHEQFPNGVKFSADDVLEMIDEQPTAYDVEKVVAEMKKHSYMVRVTEMNGTDNRKILNPAKAIEIVRKGGLE